MRGEAKNQDGFAHLIALIALVVIALGMAIGITLVKREQDNRSKAAEPVLTLEESNARVAGLGTDGKITTEKAEFIKRSDPGLYKQIADTLPLAMSAQVSQATAAISSDSISPLVAQSQPTLTPAVSSCGEITSPGIYTLQKVISGVGEQGVCIHIHNTSNVTLDCKGLSITQFTNPGQDPRAIVISNTDGFTLKNCMVNGVVSGQSQFPAMLQITTSKNGKVLDNNFKTSFVDVVNTVGLEVARNTFSNTYQQSTSDNVDIHDNSFTADSSLSGSIVASGGKYNVIRNNTINGGWDGVGKNPMNETSADDGIVLGDEQNATVVNNTVDNVYDCSIETAGFIRDGLIEGNTLRNSGACGIGGWYWSSWLRNKVQNNTIDREPTAFWFFRYGSMLPSEGGIYFKDNQFTNNTFTNPRTISLWTKNNSAIFDYVNIRGGTYVKDQLQLGGNVFTSNNFGKILANPIIQPGTMATDGGGNTCQSSGVTATTPLSCNTAGVISPSIIPTFSPIPSASSQCHSAQLQSGVPNLVCRGGSFVYDYTCTDGTKGQLQNLRACQPEATWRILASSQCALRSQCGTPSQPPASPKSPSPNSSPACARGLCGQK